MATDQAQRDYYNDRGTAALIKNKGSQGKQTPAEKLAEKKQANYEKTYAKIIARKVEEAGGIDGMTEQELNEIRTSAEKEAQLMTPWGGSAIDQAAWENRQASGGNPLTDPLTDEWEPEPGADGEPTQEQFAIYEQAFREKWQETHDQAVSDEYARKKSGITN